jgi:ATP-binding cassette subfamily B protein
VSRGRSSGIHLLPERSGPIIAAILAAVALEAAFRALISLSAGNLVDKAIIERNREALFRIVALLAGSLSAACIAGLVRDRMFSSLVGRSLGALRQSMYERLQQLSPAFHTHTAPAEILERFADNVAEVEKVFAMSAKSGLLPCLEGLFCAAAICWLDWRIGLFALLFWPWVLLAPRTVARSAERASDEYRDEKVRVLGLVEESVTARWIVRAFSLERMGITVFRKRNEALTKGSIKSGFLDALMDRLMSTGIIALQIGVLGLSVAMALSGRITAGTVVSIQLLTVALGASLLSISEYLSMMDTGRDAWRDIRAGLSDPAPVLDRRDAKTLGPVRQEILFSDVSYRYDGEHPALTGVTVRIPKGSYTAFVGPSGSGKSTMARLLMRFYDPDNGHITIDGHDIAAVTQSSLRSRMGLVLQENFVFRASLRENIRLGNSVTSDDAVMRAAAAAGVDRFASQLPRGLDTQAGEQALRLGGEASQRLAIARALLRDPDILLLDEVASALDANQEEAIDATLRAIAPGRTVISITHRLSSAADADRIYMFDQGRIVEEGSHYELMALDGFYANLWRKQAGFRFSSDGGHVDVDAARLKQFPILEKLPHDVLAELAPYFTTRTFPRGREVVCQNDPGDQFYIIARGTVGVWRTEEQTGSTMRVAVLQDGDFFGEITLITGFPRTATVRTETVCTCISLGRGQFNRLIDRFPELRRELSDVAVQRLRESSKAITVPAP